MRHSSDIWRMVPWERSLRLPTAASNRAPRLARSRSRTLAPLTALPLVAVLVAQAVATLSLVGANTAFQDEALYLWAGRLEIAHWLLGTPIPAFPTYFSGAPVIYPPLGAMANGLAGLGGARVLSLGFMLVATAMLWATVGRLYGRRAGFFAAALFALFGATLRLGAFATYDAMALGLLATAAWCAVRASGRQGSSGWLVAAALALALANATKYASVLFDPIVVGLLFSTSLRVVPVRVALGRAGTMASYVVGICAVLLILGGGEYWIGILQTTVGRVGGSTPPSSVVAESWRLTAVVVVLGAAGVLLSLTDRARRGDRLLLCVLVIAGLLVPFEYAHLGSLTSLSKHLDYGAWFVAIAAGYGVDRLIRWAPGPSTRMAATAVVSASLVLPGVLGLTQARELFHTWPNSRTLVRTTSSVLGSTRGPILAENPSLLEYYLPQGSQWRRWSSTCSIRLADGRSISQPVGNCFHPQQYVRLVGQRFFSAVVLLFGQTGQFDGAVSRALRRNPHYHLVAETSYGHQQAVVWKLRPQARAGSLPAPAPARAATPLEGLLIPTARPSPVLGDVVAAASAVGLLTLLLTLAIRYRWRRRKASYEI